MNVEQLINNYQQYNLSNCNIDYGLEQFCFINETNNIVINYFLFKIICKNYNKDFILNYIITIIKNVLNNYEKLNLHVYAKNITFIEIDKHKDFIQKIINTLGTIFVDKLDKCYIYDVSSIFTYIYSFLAILIDKKTLKKIIFK
jgi:hypothetical protein